MTEHLLLSFRALKPEETIETLEALRHQTEGRFPASDLARVCGAALTAKCAALDAKMELLSSELPARIWQRITIVQGRETRLPLPSPVQSFNRGA